MSLQEKITKWTTDILHEKSESFFLVDVTVNHASKGAKVIVYVDGDQGISIDTCADISRALSAWLEEEDAMNGKYVLEVSSPGLDQPLKLHRQYANNVGRQIKVLLQDNQTMKGALRRVTGQHIELETPVKGAKGKKKQKDVQHIQIPFNQIKKTNVLATF